MFVLILNAIIQKSSPKQKNTNSIRNVYPSHAVSRHLRKKSKSQIMNRLNCTNRSKKMNNVTLSFSINSIKPYNRLPRIFKGKSISIFIYIIKYQTQLIQKSSGIVVKNISLQRNIPIYCKRRKRYLSPSKKCKSVT